MISPVRGPNWTPSAEYFDEQRRFLAGLSTPVTPMFNGALFDLSPMHDKLVDALRPSRASMDYCRAEETGARSPRDIAVRPPNPSLPARNLGECGAGGYAKRQPSRSTRST